MSDEDKTTDPLLEILAKVRSIDTRLTSLETKVDERLRETRPIWEQALREILETRNELREFRSYCETRFDAFEALAVDMAAVKG